MSGKLRVHLENVEQIVAMNLVQVAVGQCAHVTARLADRLMNAHVLSEHVVLTCRPRPYDLTGFNQSIIQSIDQSINLIASIRLRGTIFPSVI